MSRTVRTNKYGETKTDKFQRNFNGCSCAYCEYTNKDSRRKLQDNIINKEIKEGWNYLRERYSEEDDFIIEEGHYIDEVSDDIMIFNEQLKTNNSEL